MEPSRESIDVLVVGAGPTGLTMAAELARRGVRVRLIDRQDGPSSNSRALAIQPRTLELFDLMGIIAPVLAEGLPVKGASIWSGTRRLAHLVPERDDSLYTSTIDLPQPRTEAILRDYLAGFAVQPEWRVELAGFEAGDDEVAIELRHAGGETERLRATWLLGCDGAQSTIRKALGWDFAGETTEAAFASGDLRVDWSLPHDEIQIFFNADGLMAFFPFGADRHRVVVEFEPEARDGSDTEPTLEDMQRWIAERGPAGTTVAEPAWLTSHRVSFGQAPHYRAGRVLLAGDATHVLSPAGGQGLNTGIQDAINLAWKLALVQRAGAPDALLDTYEAERAPVAAELLNRTQSTGRVNPTRGSRLDRLRSAVLPVIGGLEGLQRNAGDLVAEITVNYRDSAIVGQSERLGRRFGDSPRPGDRAPDAGPLLGPDEVALRVFDLLRHPGHTLLLFAGNSIDSESMEQLADTRAIAEQTGDTVKTAFIAPWASEQFPHVLVDRELAVHQHYGVVQASLVLIRPDGYIGFRAVPPDPAVFQQYLETILGPINRSAALDR